VLTLHLEVDVDDDPVDEQADPAERRDEAEIGGEGVAEGEQGGLRRVEAGTGTWRPPDYRFA
jgi:hypothetical protein